MSIRPEYTRVARGTLLGVALLLCSTHCGVSQKTSVNGEAVAGGDSFQAFLPGFHRAMRLIAAHVDESTLCLHADFTATANQLAQCQSFFLQAAVQMVSLSDSSSGIKLVPTSQTLPVTEYVADSWTDLGPNGNIFLNTGLLSAGSRTIVARIAHEFGHKSLFKGHYLTDGESFAGLLGYQFLDWIGKEVAFYGESHQQLAGSLDAGFVGSAASDLSGTLTVAAPIVQPSVNRCGVAVSNGGLGKYQIAATWPDFGIAPGSPAESQGQMTYAILNPDGSSVLPALPTSDLPTGTTAGLTYGLDFDPLGNLIFAGAFVGSSMTAVGSLFRLSPANAADGDFWAAQQMASSPFQNAAFYAVKAFPDGSGKYAATGFIADNVGSSNFLAAVYQSDGTLDPGFPAVAGVFGNEGMVGYNLAFRLDPDTGLVTRIVVAGYGWNGSASTAYLFVFKLNGQLDSTFGGGAPIAIPQASFQAVATQPDGKILAAGSCGAQDKRQCVLRFGTDGKLDSHFANDGTAVLPFAPAAGGGGAVSSIAVQPALDDSEDFRILAAGYQVVSGGGQKMTLTRLLPDGSVDKKSFGEQGYVFSPFADDAIDSPCALALAPGKAMVGLYRENGSSIRFSIVRFNTY